MNPQEPKTGQPKPSAANERAPGAPDPEAGRDPLDNEDTQTLSLDELGITPAEPKEVQAPPKPAAPAQPEATRAIPVAPSPKPVAEAPPKAAPAAPAKPAEQPAPKADAPKPAAPEATARLDAGAEKTQVERTARLDDAVMAGLVAAGVEKTLPPEPDDEPELAYSLQPTGGESESTPQASKSTRQRKVLSWWAWLVMGISLGIIAQVWLYFHQWQLTLEAGSPTYEALKVEPRAGLTAPSAWELSGSRFIGKDSNNQPWLFDPETTEMTMAPSPLPQDLPLDSISIVAGPPLERFTRLAWIEKDDNDLSLVLKDFDFQDATGEPPAERATASTPRYLIAPIPNVPDPQLSVADTANPDLGTLLVVAGSDGSLGAWSAVAPKDTNTSASLRQVWSLNLPAAPVAAPRSWIDLRGAEPRTWLMAPTASGLTLVDAVAGTVVETQAWNPEINSQRKLAMIPMRQGDRGWGWFASNGEQAYQWLFSNEGKIFLSAVTIPATKAKDPATAPQVLTFPDPNSQGNDQVMVKADSGDTVWLNFTQIVRQGAESDKALSTPEVGPVAAVDADGDGYQDLIGIGDFLMWHRLGPADADRTWDTQDWVDASKFRAVSSDVYWRLGDTGLIGVFFDKNWTPSQVTLPITMNSDYIKVLQLDWKRRQGS